jgi:hypothetical protein
MNEELLRRPGVLDNEAHVAEIVRELDVAGSLRERVEFELPPLGMTRGSH